MFTRKRKVFSFCFILVLVALLLSVSVFAAAEGTSGYTVDCSDCEATGACFTCHGIVDDCADCGGENVCQTCSGTGVVPPDSNMYGTIWSLLPPLVAIALALITREVYSSLFIGIVVGALFCSNFNIETTINTIIVDGIIGSLADSGSIGILVFLVVLGVIVIMMNRAGGSAAYGQWAEKRIKSRYGAMGSTFGLGLILFVDDYFNCLTVGGVMRPVTDKFNISRAKLAYIIDATAAPICMIAPISSWAAAVSGVVEGYNGIELFVRAIPYNFYSLLTIVMVVALIVMKFDFASMAVHERNAKEKGDIYTVAERPYAGMEAEKYNERGRVIDLVLPVIILIVSCIIGMIYTGGFFSGESFIDSFANCSASIGLALGSVVSLIIITAFYLIRRTLNFKECMSSIPEGFKAMVPAILILTFAWTLSSMTGNLGADVYVHDIIAGSAEGLKILLPAIIFIIAVGLSVATGTSWGTFGILIPIITAVFASQAESLLIMGISACLAGAVCGDHCSPISDTTIMASAGAQCDHMTHVWTQLPYAITVAAVSFVSYIIAGIVKSAWIALPIAVALMLLTLIVIKKISANKVPKSE